MKIFTKKGILQKTILVILTVLCINFIVPTYSHAFLSNAGGVLANAAIDLFAMLGDAGASFMQWCMTGKMAAGDSLFRDSAIMVEQGDDRIIKGTGEATMKVKKDDLDLGKNTDGDTYQVPVISYTPEEIFSNKVPYLDINFISPKPREQFDANVKGTAEILQPTISGWYIALRNLSIVGNLCALVYVGIKIIMSSISTDKAKHKQMFMDWLIALCLLFFLHYIMSFTLVLIDSVNEAITGNNYTSETVVVSVDDGTKFSTNVMGAARFMVQSKDNMESFAYLIVYLALIFYTGIFTYHYLKRVLTMAFLTIIAPLVALTYPIDKMGDGKAQAFNMWIKEYVYTALIQPFHLIVYMIFIGSAIELVTTNYIFAIAALAFVLPAEKLLKKMFGFDRAPLGMMGPLAGFTAASLANKFGAKGSSKAPSAPNKGGNNGSSSSEEDKTKFKRTHGTDGINYGENTRKQNDVPKAGTSAEGKTQEREDSEEKKVAEKAAEAFAEQQRRQEEQEQQRQMEEQQRQMEEQQEIIRQQQLEQTEQQSKMNEEKGNKESKQPGKVRQGIRNVASAHGGKKGIALKGARTLGRAAKFTARTGFRATLGAAGTVFGAAGGLASGKGIAGVIAGATAGRKIGRGVANTAENAVGTVGRVAAGVGRAAVRGTRNTIDTFNGNTALNDKHTAKMFMKDASTDQYIRDKLTKENNGQAPSAQRLRSEKQKIQKYADEGMTDIAQIYRARKAEKIGVSESQSAKIALLAKDRNITSDILGDKKKYEQRKEDFTQEFINKGFSETEASKQADYVLNVMKAQNGQAYDINKIKGKASATTSSQETKTPKANNSGGNNSGTETSKANNSGRNNSGTKTSKANNSGGNNSGTKTSKANTKRKTNKSGSNRSRKNSKK